MGEHDTALVGLGIHPACRRACRFAWSSGPGHRAPRQAKTESWIAERLDGARVANASEHAREIMLLVEGSMALTLIHGGREYFDAAARAAKRLVGGKANA